MRSLSPVHRQSLSESVFLQLQERIVRGELAADAALPSERELSAVLGVNRGAVREAIKRLQQAGLVAVRQGGNHVVRDYQSGAGLELLPSLLIDGAGRLDGAVLRAIMEMRSALAPEIAAAAAQRGEEGLAARLDALLGRMTADEQNLPRLQELVFEFWTALVAASGNIAFRLAFNSMTRSYVQAWDALRATLAQEFRDAANLRAIASAVRARDAAKARAAARRHVETGRIAMDRALGASRETGH